MLTYVLQWMPLAWTAGWYRTGKMKVCHTHGTQCCSRVQDNQCCGERNTQNFVVVEGDLPFLASPKNKYKIKS